MRYQIVEDRSVAEQTYEIINLEHPLADAEMKLSEVSGHVHSGKISQILVKFWHDTQASERENVSDDLMIPISIKEEHRNQTHKMPVEHQPRANLIVGKQKVNKINLNSKAINKSKASKNKKPKANNHAGTVGRLETGPSFVLIKRPRLDRQMSTWLWEVLEAISGRTTSMGNSSTAEVLGIGSVDLEVSFRAHFVAKKSSSCSHCYLDDGLFKVRVENSKIDVFDSIILNVESSTLWHSSLLLTSGLPKYLWGEALNTAYHILNRVPLKHNTSTPFEFWKDRKPSLKYFRVCGCLAKLLVPEHKRKKLDSKTVDVVLLGYMETSYALRYLEYLSSTSIPEHVEKMSNVGVSPSSSNQTHKESDEPRRSKIDRIVKDFGSDFVTYNIKDDPITFKDAMTTSEAKQWKEAVKSEMDSIVSNGMWVLVDLSSGCTTIGCKWIFKKNMKPDGTIDKFKARLVAKGFKQKEGINYFDTYSPIARLTTIWVLIALASVYNLPINQMDVKIAFFYGELEEEIYMDQPKGFVAHDNEFKVCKLVKSLYELKQAPKTVA
ncbi:UNVERIFIED_CONTAM: Retrovirus-related Pol polyprotein from transposon TNT 1-94 [Sesamum indicum]